MAKGKKRFGCNKSRHLLTTNRSGSFQLLDKISEDATITFMESELAEEREPFRGITKQMSACSESTIKHVIENAAKNAGAMKESKEAAYNIVYDSVRESKNGIVEFDQFVPWQDNIFEIAANEETLSDKAKEAAFVIFPSNRGGYNVQCIPPEPGSFDQKIPLPEQWRGLRGEELQGASGVTDAIFCHPAGFICAAESLDSAREMAEEAREMAFMKAISEMETKESEIREAYKEKFGCETMAAENAVEEMKKEIMGFVPGLEAYMNNNNDSQSGLDGISDMVSEEEFALSKSDIEDIEW